MSKARELSELIGNAGGTSEKVLSGRKNMLINGDFKISQRASYTTATNISNGSYMLDRWKMIKQGTGSSATIQDLGGSIRMEATASFTGTFRAYQKLEDKGLYKRLSNDTVTMSAWVKSNTSNARIQAWINAWVGFDQPHSGNGEWEKLTATYTFGDVTSYADGNLNFQVGIDGFNSTHVSISTGDYVEVKDFQLELGKVATPFENRSYGEELALCQRYYTEAYNHAPYYAGFVFNNSQVTVASLSYPVEMRATPTFTSVSPSHITTAGNWGIYQATNGWSSSGYTPSFSSAGTHHCQVGFTSVAGVGNTNTYICSGGFKADAEL